MDSGVRAWHCPGPRGRLRCHDHGVAGFGRCPQLLRPAVWTAGPRLRHASIARVARQAKRWHMSRTGRARRHIARDWPGLCVTCSLACHAQLLPKHVDAQLVVACAHLPPVSRGVVLSGSSWAGRGSGSFRMHRDCRLSRARSCAAPRVAPHAGRVLLQLGGHRLECGSEGVEVADDEPSDVEPTASRHSWGERASFARRMDFCCAKGRD